MTDAKDDSDNMDEKEGIQSIGDLLTQRQRKRFQTGDTLLGRYRILGELGQGGMGLVFRCLDEVGGIEVAVKMLPPEVSHDSGEMEDVRENFRLVSSLVHQNICAVRTLEKDPATGEYFLVMELAQGVNLRTWRKQRKAQCPTSNNQYPTSNGTAGIPLAEILPIVRQIAAALDYAHEHKVIHRDVKPSNVMVDARGHAKVLDFGLAAQIHTSFSRVSHVRYGTSGTGPYMAPEQWEGQYQDAATDQYALAVLTYELLTGHCPFESHEATVLRESVLKSVPKCPPGLPAAAWAALQRGLAKEREERFASCGEFARALGGERISPQRAQRTQRTGRGWKWVVGLVVLAGLILSAPQIRREIIVENHYFQIRRIEVTTDGSLGREDILEYARVREGLSIFAVRPTEARNRLLSVPIIENAHVKRRFPNTLIIEVFERVAVARLGRSESGIPLAVNATGHVLGPSSVRSSLPVVLGVRDIKLRPGDVVNDPMLTNALKILAFCNQARMSNLLAIATVDLKNDDMIQVEFISGDSQLLSPGSYEEELQQLLNKQLVRKNEQNQPAQLNPSSSNRFGAKLQSVSSTAPNNENVIYVFRAGDSLGTVSTRYYGTPSKWKVIFDANHDRLVDANNIPIGTRLIIPALASVPPMEPSGANADELLAQARDRLQVGDHQMARQTALDALAARPGDAEIEEFLSELAIPLLASQRFMPEKLEHVVQPGEYLGKLAATYNTPVSLIAKANNIQGANLRVGETLRLFDGNAHAFTLEVSKSRNDLVVALDGKYFKRYRIGFGENTNIPTGTFKIVDKISQPAWHKPGSKVIPYGHPDNWLGTYWLALDLPGCGIHGTWEPDSIGKNGGAGCIRMLNSNVEELYTILPKGTVVSIME